MTNKFIGDILQSLLNKNFVFRHEERSFLSTFIVLLILFFVFIIVYFSFIIPFIREREYILREINRATDEEEYIYWKDELKRLYRNIFFLNKNSN